MMIAVFSGIFGRVMFGHWFGNITKRYELLHKIDVFLERDLREASINSPVIRRVMEIKSSNFPTHLGIIAAAKEWAYIRKEKSELIAQIDKKYLDKNMLNKKIIVKCIKIISKQRIY